MADPASQGTPDWETQPCPECGRPRSEATGAACSVRHKAADRDAEIVRLLDGVRPTLEAMSSGIVLSARKLRAFGASEALLIELNKHYGMSE